MISAISRYSNSFMTVLFLVIFTVMVAISSNYPPGARFMVFVVGFPAIALCLLQLFLDARARRRGTASADGQDDLRKAEATAAKATGHSVQFDAGAMLAPEAALDPRERIRREAIVWGYFLALIAGIILFGFHLAVPVFLIFFLRLRAHASWIISLGSAALAAFILFFAFEHVLHISLHSGFITDYVMSLVSD